MSTTPLWLPLVIAALGIVGTVAGTIVGVILTQRQANRRDELNWARERARERERWAREDAERTFGHRRDAYAEFYEALGDMALLIQNFGLGMSEEPLDSDGHLPSDFQSQAFRKLQRLRLYAIPATTAAAEDAYNTALQWGEGTKFDQDNQQFYSRKSTFQTAEERLREAMRTDLSVPSTSAFWLGIPAPSGNNASQVASNPR
jgi:hypothetical protein